jgi:hypothetical protein
LRKSVLALMFGSLLTCVKTVGMKRRGFPLPSPPFTDCHGNSTQLVCVCVFLTIFLHVFCVMICAAYDRLNASGFKTKLISMKYIQDEWVAHEDKLKQPFYYHKATQSRA